MEININEESYINEHLKRREEILDKINRFLSNSRIEDIDVWYFESIKHKKKGVILHCEDGSIMDVRCYEEDNSTNIIAYASVNIEGKWRWIGVVSNDETVCNLVKNMIERIENLKREMDNKVSMYIKEKYERIGIKRG